MDIKVLGPGCQNCQTLETRTRKVLDDLGLTASVDKVTDYSDIAAYGVVATPALVIDERVVVSGRVPAVAELQQLFAETTS